MQALLRAGVRGVAAAVLGGVVGAVLTRGLMRLVIIVAGGTPQFTWTGLAFIALFYVVFLTPGAIALAWSRARWPLVVFGIGAVAIPVQAAGIATTDLPAVGRSAPGHWALLAPARCDGAVYAAQAVIAYRLAGVGCACRSGRLAAGEGQRSEPLQYPVDQTSVPSGPSTLAPPGLRYSPLGRA